MVTVAQKIDQPRLGHVGENPCGIYVEWPLARSTANASTTRPQTRPQKDPLIVVSGFVGRLFFGELEGHAIVLVQPPPQVKVPAALAAKRHGLRFRGIERLATDWAADQGHEDAPRNDECLDFKCRKLQLDIPSFDTRHFRLVAFGLLFRRAGRAFGVRGLTLRAFRFAGWLIGRSTLLVRIAAVIGL